MCYLSRRTRPYTSSSEQMRPSVLTPVFSGRMSGGDEHDVPAQEKAERTRTRFGTSQPKPTYPNVCAVVERLKRVRRRAAIQVALFGRACLWRTGVLNETPLEYLYYYYYLRGTIVNRTYMWYSLKPIYLTISTHNIWSY